MRGIRILWGQITVVFIIVLIRTWAAAQWVAFRRRTGDIWPSAPYPIGRIATALVWQSARGTVVPWVVQVDKLGHAQTVAATVADYRPTDPQIAFHLGRFIERLRAIPADAIVVR